MMTDRIKIFIDDIRFPPDNTRDDSFVSYLKSWRKQASINELLFKIIMNDVEEISFDHDLADESDFNWYEVMKLVLQYYRLTGKHLPKISIHSANPIWVERMERLLQEHEQRFLDQSN